MSPQPEQPHASRLRDMEATDKLLFAGIVMFSVLLIVISKWSPGDGQTFQVISGLLTGFGAAFFARMNPQSKKLQSPPPGGSETTFTQTAAGETTH